MKTKTLVLAAAVLLAIVPCAQAQTPVKLTPEMPTETLGATPTPKPAPTATPTKAESMSAATPTPFASPSLATTAPVKTEKPAEKKSPATDHFEYGWDLLILPVGIVVLVVITVPAIRKVIKKRKERQAMMMRKPTDEAPPEEVLKTEGGWNPEHTDDTNPKGTGLGAATVGLFLALGLAQAGTADAAPKPKQTPAVCSVNSVSPYYGVVVRGEKEPRRFEAFSTGCNNITEVGGVKGVTFTRVNFSKRSGRITALVTATEEVPLKTFRFNVLDGKKNETSKEAAVLSILDAPSGFVYNKTEEVRKTVVDLAKEVRETRKGIANFNDELASLKGKLVVTTTPTSSPTLTEAEVAALVDERVKKILDEKQSGVNALALSPANPALDAIEEQVKEIMLLKRWIKATLRNQQKKSKSRKDKDDIQKIIEAMDKAERDAEKKKAMNTVDYNSVP